MCDAFSNIDNDNSSAEHKIKQNEDEIVAKNDDNSDDNNKRCRRVNEIRCNGEVKEINKKGYCNYCDGFGPNS